MITQQFTTVDRIIAKLYRDLKLEEIDEGDVIEWIGEALGFLNVAEVQEEAVAFLNVKNYECDLPNNFHAVLQVAKYEEGGCYHNTTTKIGRDIPNEQKNLIADLVFKYCKNETECCEPKEFRPYFDMQWSYTNWLHTDFYENNFVPVRLANNTFFNSVVCREKNDKEIYSKPCINDEYTIVGTTEKKLRFSFKDGVIALSYLRNAIDNETGYPLVPDNSYYITAITYYIKWKMSEFLQWNGDKAHMNLAGDYERKWISYARKAKNNAKMPKTLDQFQNMLEETHHLIPKQDRYYGFFGNLGQKEKLIYGR